MKVQIFEFGTGETKILDNVKSVDIRSEDTCLVVNFRGDGWELVDTDKKRVMIKITE